MHEEIARCYCVPCYHSARVVFCFLSPFAVKLRFIVSDKKRRSRLVVLLSVFFLLLVLAFLSISLSASSSSGWYGLSGLH